MGAIDTPGYVPRETQATVLYGVVAEGLETFLARARERERPLPWFVEREFRGFLSCGIHANGFVRVHCDGCGFDRLVPFSCKGRGFCSSCLGRRMADTAAHLVDRVIPHVPVRQWVLTLPVGLRYRMAFDAQLTSAILRAFLRTLFASLRRRARTIREIRYPQCGSVTFIQRFGDALNLNVHFHTLALDGVFDADDPEGIVFVPLDAPDNDGLLRIVRGFARRLQGVLEKFGFEAEAGAHEADPLTHEQPMLAELSGAAVQGRVATGPRRGCRVVRLGDRIDADALPDAPRPDCVTENGISLHAGVAVPAGDRARLERLSRYAARPPVSTERLSQRPDGRLLYRLRHRWRDGTTHMLFEPSELIERLAVLVPPPRFHTVRYHGILAPAASCRDAVLPRLPNDSGQGAHAVESDPDPAPRERRLAWSKLLARVFAVNALNCPRCGATMRILATIHAPESVRKILDCVGLASRPPPVTSPEVQVEPEDDGRTDTT